MVAIGLVLLVLWAILWLGFKIVSGFIHIILIVGIALLIWSFIKKGANAVSSRL